MAAESLLCAVCVKRAAILYCPCSGSKTNLCGACVGLHAKRYPQLRHVVFPVDAPVGDPAAYLREVKKLADEKTELEQIPAKIDQCCYELTEAVNFVVDKLTSYREECVGQLQTWKASLGVEVAEAVSKVQAVLSGRKAESRSKYSLKSFKPGNFDSLSALIDSELRHSREVRESWKWLHQHLTQFRSPLLQEIRRLKEDEARKVAPADPSRIVYVDCDKGVYEFTRAENGLPQKRQLYQFDEEQGVDKPFINDGSSYTLLDAERLISCGSVAPYAFSSCALCTTPHGISPYDARILASYEIDVIAKKIGRRIAYIVFLSGATKFTRLPDMNHPRACPGIVKHGDCVFVFGGVSGPGLAVTFGKASKTSGEYRSISAGGPWTLASGEMSVSRSCFTPCVMGSFIYLCGGSRSETIDLFDIERKAFVGCAGVQLPEASRCITFTRGSAALVVISSTKVSVFPFVNGSLQQGQSKDHRQLGIRPNSTPVLIPGDGLSIYFTCKAEGKGKCVRLILEADNSVRTIEEVSA